MGGGGPGTCNAHPYIYIYIYHIHTQIFRYISMHPGVLHMPMSPYMLLSIFRHVFFKKMLKIMALLQLQLRNQSRIWPYLPTNGPVE